MSVESWVVFRFLSFFPLRWCFSLWLWSSDSSHKCGDFCSLCIVINSTIFAISVSLLLIWAPLVTAMTTNLMWCAYLLFSRCHLSFPLHLAPSNACKLSGHSPRTADRDWTSFSSLYRRDNLYCSNAFVSRLLCYNLYLGPLRSGADLGFSRIGCHCGNRVGIRIYRSL